MINSLKEPADSETLKLGNVPILQVGKQTLKPKTIDWLDGLDYCFSIFKVTIPVCVCGEEG